MIGSGLVGGAALFASIGAGLEAAKADQAVRGNSDADIVGPQNKLLLTENPDFVAI